jgi:hypothetical protein
LDALEDGVQVGMYVPIDRIKRVCYPFLVVFLKVALQGLHVEFTARHAQTAG